MDKLIIDHTADADMGKQLTAELKLKAAKPIAIKMEYYWKGESALALAWHLDISPPPSKDPDGRRGETRQASGCGRGGCQPERRMGIRRLRPRRHETARRAKRTHRAGCKANKNTIVVLNVGSPVEMPWIDKVPAVLQLWYNGQEQGNALADILFGDVNPSGKLPTTFPVRLAG
ncbi:MAG: glycoside hydrolase family 3 C-terminal domain-containing protein [Marinilabiliales bacterium]|nr:glycoside hydrolase family 3 C-terminal domain-containing protein [Marinilabiliales bacterium]